MTAPSSPSVGEHVVNPEPESRLEQLTAEYARLKPQVARFEEIKVAIKAELSRRMVPGQTEALLTCWALDRPLSYRWVPEGWRIDTKTLKTQDPETFAKWAVRRRGYWDLRAVS